MRLLRTMAHPSIVCLEVASHQKENRMPSSPLNVDNATLVGGSEICCGQTTSFFTDCANITLSGKATCTINFPQTTDVVINKYIVYKYQ